MAAAERTKIDETVVAAIWERQAFDRSVLAVLGFSVVFRGLPSDAGGPDYQDAMIAVRDAQVVTGDVEFHVRSSDWYRHGHHRDRRYDSVVLHVVWSDDCQGTRCANGAVVPVLPLNRAGGELSVREGVRQGMLHRDPCTLAFSRLSTREVRARVRGAGVARFNQRTARFESDLSVESADQVIYAALLEGLGYASNREAFLELAAIVPFALLQNVPECERAATLLEASGLVPPAAWPPPARLSASAWRLARLRPGNHPVTRIRGISAVLNGLGRSLSANLSDMVANAARPSVLRSALTARTDKSSFIGAGRADELAVSAVLPFVAALDTGSRRAFDLFMRFSSPPANRWTRHMMGQLESAGHTLSRLSAPEHQGLHHLYHSFCRTGATSQCPACGLENGEPAITCREAS